MTPTRTPINPWPWSLPLGYTQGELVTGATRTLHVSGQAAMSASGEPQHAGDLQAQLALALDNLEAVLAEAGMGLADLVRLTVYATDVDLLFGHYGVLAGRLGGAGAQPATTVLGVTRLVLPDLLVELEATAVG
ncbi:RidA family protein [Paraconexibacter algicola]|uniref:Enamine deaminase RidA n=1 Tax=Paraconexibacter algicola TaxID=2133960 RepID=A0A2T4UKI6_9ACTN|nr:RidA family protein [Paraconexibacter algicola]PTL59740.1 enamine deaminase RidA [Paraconexibacter algicola]